jgi:UDP-2,4-diacetamido-2,4,6-trideoxy-beta-L-altropyranose hydrolase
MSSTLPVALRRVVFFADASQHIGAGHQMRCLALAEELSAQGSSIALAARSVLPTTEAAWRTVGAEVRIEAALDHLRVARELGATFAVVDDYSLDASVEARLRFAGMDVLALDDRYDPHVAATLVLNPAADVRERYPLATASLTRAPTVLYGLCFASVRATFRQAIGDDVPPTHEVLVTLGATDPGGFTLPLVQALREAGLPVVVTAPSGAHERIAALAATGARVAIGVDLASIARRGLVAVSASSTSALELASVGAAVVLVGTADNQRPTWDALLSEAAAHAGAFHEDRALDTAAVTRAVCALRSNIELASALGERARRVVDGGGAARVVRAMAHPALVVRRAKAADARRLFDWANDATTRAASFSAAPIAWETHVNWLQRRLSDPGTLLLIGEGPYGAVGQVRFDLRSDTGAPDTRSTAIVSVGLAPEHRGRGLATPLLCAGLEELYATTDVDDVVAEIKPGNVRSLRAFAAAGFTETRPAPADRVRLAHRRTR